MDLTQHRAIALGHHKEALKREFADWRARTARTQPLEKHNSQIERITNQLDEFLDKEVVIPAGGVVTFAANERAFAYILGAHRIWDYFRSKLALRDIAWLRDELLCADELAWECYRPARERARAAGIIAAVSLKEPPLVFFTSDSSPFAQARNTPFVPEGITDRDFRNFGLAVLSLPIPIVGVPWFQFNHLPAAVVIGHEVGHAIERDFALDPVLQELINGLVLPTERKAAWLAWRHEVFADVYAVLCTGPSYVLALMDYLVSDIKAIQQETLTSPAWGSYPTRFLRMELNFEILARLGLLKPFCDTLAALGLADGDPVRAWRNTYQFHLMDQFQPDVESVVTALLDGPYPAFGNVNLLQVIVFTQRDLVGGHDLAYDVNQGNTLPQGVPLRRLFAAATLAYYVDPQAYARRNGSLALIQRIRQAIPLGVRSGDASLADQERQQLEVADRAAGRKLTEFF